MDHSRHSMSNTVDKGQSPTWIDLTDMIAWRGHFTGVQRVVHSYASRFAEDGARFFIYDKIDNRHVEINFSYIEEIQKSSDNIAITKRQQLKKTIGKPYYALSAAQKQMLAPLVRTSNKMARTALHVALDKRKAMSPYRSFPEAAFGENDTVVLIGAGWNEPGSLELLCTIRREKGIRLVVHINDILPVYQPQLFADSLPKLFTPYIDMAVRNSDVITVISEATKRDLQIFCKERDIDGLPIRVVRLGEDVQTVRSAKPSTPAVNGNFVLCVGTLEIRKNYLLIYQAAKLAQLEGKDFPTVIIAGRKGWLTEDLAHVIEHDPFTQEKIYWLSNASDEELNWLYEHCMFTIFPSLCEGWGLPMVESMHHGKMCLASNVSSMLEIGDGLVDYFSPYDARSCMEKILAYSTDSGYDAKNQLVKDTYTIYTWDESYDSFTHALR